MGNMEMDGFCWMCAAVWIGGIILAALIIYLLIKLIRKNRNS